MRKIIFILGLLLITANAFGQGGMLDAPAFNSSGYNVTFSAPGRYPAGIDAQDTGPLKDFIVAAFSDDNTSNRTFTVQRFLPNNGLLDLSFGNPPPLSKFVFPAGVSWAEAAAMTSRNTNNMIYVAGQTGSGCAVVQFNASGQNPVLLMLQNPPGTTPSECRVADIEVKNGLLYVVGTTTLASIPIRSAATIWRVKLTPFSKDVSWNGGGWVRTTLSDGAQQIDSFGIAVAFTQSSGKVWAAAQIGGTANTSVVAGYNSNGSLLTGTFGNVTANINNPGLGGIHRLNLPAAPKWTPTMNYTPGDMIANDSYIWVGGGFSGAPRGQFRLVRIPVNNGSTNYVYQDVDLCRHDTIRQLEFINHPVFTMEGIIAVGPGDGSTLDVSAAKYQKTGTNPGLQNSWAAPSGSVLSVSGATTPPNPCTGSGDRRRISSVNPGIGFAGMALQTGSTNVNKIVIAGYDGNKFSLMRLRP